MGLFTGAITLPIRVARAGAAELAGSAIAALRVIEELLREDSPGTGSPDVPPPPRPRAPGRRPPSRQARSPVRRRRREVAHVRPAPPPPPGPAGPAG